MSEDAGNKLAFSTPFLGPFADYVDAAGYRRLANCIKAENADQGEFPFASLEAYCRMPMTVRHARLRKIPNLGKKSILDLEYLIPEFLRVNTSPSILELGRVEAEEVDPGSHMFSEFASESSFFGFVNRYGGTRLNNVVSGAFTNGTFPYSNLSEYLADGASARARKLAALPNCGKGTIRELDELAQRFATEGGVAGEEDIAAPLERMGPVKEDELFNLLSEREAEIIRRRFGMAPYGMKQTLEEVGQAFGVTRERIRQIESKGLKKLKIQSGLVLWQSFLDENRKEIIDSIFNGRSIIVDVPRLRGIHKLAVKLVFESVEEYLANECQKIGRVWINGTIDEEMVAKAANNLDLLIETPARFPLTVASVSEAWDVDLQCLGVALSNNRALKVFKGYLINGGKSARKKRTVNLLRLFDNWLVGNPVPLWDIKVEYWRHYPKDQCNGRDLLICLSEYRGHFINMRELGWARIQNNALNIRVEERRLPALDAETLGRLMSEPVKSGDGLVNRIFRMFQHTGPMRLKEAAELFASQNPEYSPTSIYPMLVTFAVFLKLAPGIIGIRAHLADPVALSQARSLLEDQRHVELYLASRLAGTPYLQYPLWDIEMEMRWCNWTFEKADDALLGQLLDSVDFDKWPIAEEDRTWWEEKSRILSARPRPVAIRNLDERAVDLEMIGTALAAASIHGETNWMHINQALGWRIETTRVVVILSVLVHVGAISPKGDWYFTHSLTSKGRELLARFFEARAVGAVLQPQEFLSKALIDEAASGWAHKFPYEEMIGQIHFETGDEAPMSSDGELSEDEVDALYQALLISEVEETIEGNITNV